MQVVEVKIEVTLTAASDHSSVMLAFGQYWLTPRINGSPSLHSTEHVEEKTQRRIYFRDWFIPRFMHGNLMLTYLDVTNPTTQFSSIKTPQRLNTADMIESDFVSNCGSTVTILHVVLLCSKRLGPPRGVRFVWTVLIMLPLMVVATVAPPIQPPLPTSSSKCKQSHFWSILPWCALCKSCLVYSISLQSSVPLSREEMFFISHWD